MYKINDCHNVNDFRKLAKKNYHHLYSTILMGLLMTRLLIEEIPNLSKMHTNPQSSK